MHLKADAVTGAVRHRRNPSCESASFRAVAVLLHCLDGGLVDAFSANARFHSRRGGLLGGDRRLVHRLHFVRNIAMNDGSRAVAIVKSDFVAREDIDDHRLSGAKRAGAGKVTIRRLRT